MITLQHSGCLGDIIHHLASIKDFTDEPIRIVLPYNAPDGRSGKVRMTAKQVDMFLPLLRALPYIHEADRAYEYGTTCATMPFDVNLDTFRDIPFDTSRGDIARFLSYAYPVMVPRLYEPWINLEPDTTFQHTIIINRTLRYRNPAINYKLLTGKNAVFVGTPEEYRSFTKETLRVPYVEPKDFLELARWISGCKLFIGNQSFCFALAQAQMSPRLLEVCPTCPNVPIHGWNGTDFLTQVSFQALLELLLSVP